MISVLLASLLRILVGVLCLSVAFGAALFILFLALTYPWGFFLALIVFLLF